MKVFILFFISITFSISGYSQLNGCYCCESNWTRITFGPNDSIKVIWPFYLGGHMSGFGSGTYKIRNDSMFINYTHRSKTSFSEIRTNETANDSIDLIFDDDNFWADVSYFKKDTLILPDKIMRFERSDDSLCIQALATRIIIPSKMIMDKSISGFKVHLDDIIYIDKKNDCWPIQLMNDTEIQFVGGKLLTKSNCKKKPQPIY